MCYTLLDDTDTVTKRRLDLFKIIGEDVAGVAGGVLKGYGKYTGSELIDMTHRNGTPWHKAYKLGRDNVITTKSIAKFYRHLSVYDDAR